MRHQGRGSRSIRTTWVQRLGQKRSSLWPARMLRPTLHQAFSTPALDNALASVPKSRDQAHLPRVRSFHTLTARHLRTRHEDNPLPPHTTLLLTCDRFWRWEQFGRASTSQDLAHILRSREPYSTPTLVELELPCLLGWIHSLRTVRVQRAKTAHKPTATPPPIRGTSYSWQTLR